MTVMPDGSVKADLSGFSGEHCLEEADRLAEVLARFGLLVSPTAVRKKTASEVEAETGTASDPEDWVPTRRK